MNQPESQPTDQTILLVGGPGSSIGAALLAELGTAYRVAATWLSQAPDLAPQERVRFYPLDVTDAAAVGALLEQVERELGPVDVLINNAGIFRGRAVALMSADAWQQVLDVNLTGVFTVCKAVARPMMQRRRGKIINIASLKGVIGGAGEAAYAASKAGVIALTKSLARELAPYQIAVNAVCPGFISSELNRFDAQRLAEAAAQSLLDINHNLDDLVHFIHFLCGDKLKSVTGQVFYIDSRVH